MLVLGKEGDGNEKAAQEAIRSAHRGHKNSHDGAVVDASSSSPANKGTREMAAVIRPNNGSNTSTNDTTRGKAIVRTVATMARIDKPDDSGAPNGHPQRAVYCTGRATRRRPLPTARAAHSAAARSPDQTARPPSCCHIPGRGGGEEAGDVGVEGDLLCMDAAAVSGCAEGKGQTRGRWGGGMRASAVWRGWPSIRVKCTSPADPKRPPRVTSMGENPHPPRCLGKEEKRNQLNRCCEPPPTLLDARCRPPPPPSACPSFRRDHKRAEMRPRLGSCVGRRPPLGAGDLAPPRRAGAGVCVSRSRHNYGGWGSHTQIFDAYQGPGARGRV